MKIIMNKSDRISYVYMSFIRILNAFDIAEYLCARASSLVCLYKAM